MGAAHFTPYIEIPGFEDYALKPVHVKADREHRFQHSDAELTKLEDLVKSKRPELILLTDDVYGTFAPGFRSTSSTSWPTITPSCCSTAAVSMHRTGA